MYLSGKSGRGEKWSVRIEPTCFAGRFDGVERDNEMQKMMVKTGG